MIASAIVLMHDFFLLLNFAIHHEVKILSHLNNGVLELAETLDRTHPLQLLSNVPYLHGISCLKSHLFKLALRVLSDQLHLFLLRYLGWVRCIFQDARFVIYSFIHRSTILDFLYF
jgi:hypothetical protein